MTKTLKKFLEKNDACKEGYIFAENLTLKQFLNTCERGDWILWLFKRLNPKDLKNLTLAKGHCAKTVIDLMKDERSKKAVQAAIDFGEVKISKEELDIAADAAYAAADAAYDAYYYKPDAAYDAADAAHAAADADYAAAAAAAAVAAIAAAAAIAATAAYVAATTAAKKKNQKETADICRKYLPLEIWNTNLI